MQPPASACSKMVCNKRDRTNLSSDQNSQKIIFKRACNSWPPETCIHETESLYHIRAIWSCRNATIYDKCFPYHTIISIITNSINNVFLEWLYYFVLLCAEIENREILVTDSNIFFISLLTLVFDISISVYFIKKGRYTYFLRFIFDISCEPIFIFILILLIMGIRICTVNFWYSQISYHIVQMYCRIYNISQCALLITVI